jgi:hypothetical protein
MECDDLKTKLYACLKDYDLGYDVRYLKLAARKKYEDINLFKINRSILNECKYEDFTKCLENKFSLNKINEKLLYQFYEDKYKKLKKKSQAATVKDNRIVLEEEKPKKSKTRI